jgi:hypothetical protein
MTERSSDKNCTKDSYYTWDTFYNAINPSNILDGLKTISEPFKPNYNNSIFRNRENFSCAGNCSPGRKLEHIKRPECNGCQDFKKTPSCWQGVL